MTVAGFIDLLSLLIGAILTLVLSVGALLLWDWWDTRELHPDVTYKPAVETGTLICDFVDHDQLRSIAEQNEVPLPAAQVVEEHETSSDHTSTVKFWQRRKGKRQNKATTTTPRDDSNELVKRVLQKLLDEGSLNYQVAMAYRFGMQEEAEAEENASRETAIREGLQTVVRFRTEETAEKAAKAARVALDRYAQRDPASMYIAAFEEAANRSAWVLVDVSWALSKTDGEICLRAKHLNQHPTYAASEPLETVPMPDGLGITVKIPVNELESFGERHLGTAEEEIRVKVFGTASRCASGTLEIVPVAVYSQMG